MEGPALAWVDLVRIGAQLQALKRAALVELLLRSWLEYPTLRTPTGNAKSPSRTVEATERKVSGEAASFGRRVAGIAQMTSSAIPNLAESCITAVVGP